MTPLHSVKPVEPPVREALTGTPTCPCGHTSFQRLETGWTTDRHTVTFSDHRSYPEEDYNNRGGETETTDPWYCWNCNLEVSEELDELIEASR